MKKKLEKKINLFLSLIIIVVLLPLLITIVFQRMELEGILAGNVWENNSIDETENAVETDKDKSTEAEKKVIGIVAKEISIKYDRQAILAQCVIARTNLYDAWENNTPEPEALALDEMQELWGDDFNKIYQNIKECVRSTKDEVLVWNQKCIYAAYHAVSAGTTRNIDELYTDANMPYLKEEICSGDTMAEGYLAVLYWKESEFLEKCRQLFPENAPEDMSQIQILERDSTDYVLQVQVNSGTYSGEEFRSSFGLNSSCFTITQTQDQVRIVTKGIGHGVGLSQYTANTMAQEGNSYEKILNYFYQGAELKSIQELN